MKDAIGREIRTGDVLVYPTRSGSTQDINVAIVNEVVKKKTKWGSEREFMRATCIASSQYGFKERKRKVVLHASSQMFIVNGIDIDDINKTTRSKKVVFHKTYYGFEDINDIHRDVSECFDQRFNAQMKDVPSEFTGKMTVRITYEDGER